MKPGLLIETDAEAGSDHKDAQSPAAEISAGLDASGFDLFKTAEYTTEGFLALMCPFSIHELREDKGCYLY